MTDITARIVPHIASLDADQWDALNPGGNPFVGHAFLNLLEASGSVGEGTSQTGWSPTHIVIDGPDSAPIGILPAYLKSHSQGEYIFDHHWADAYERAGGRYYPKLQIASPLSPVPGPRILARDTITALQLLGAAETLVHQHGLSSAHATFIEEGQLDLFQQAGWLIRTGSQFHWENAGYQSFDDFLNLLASRKRRALRKERAKAQAICNIVTLQGAEIGAEHVAAMWAFYQDTGMRKWGQPYLTRAFFERMSAALGDRLVLFLAYQDGTPVAGALNILGPDCLYGRYWGCNRDIPFLHFELCYYRAIDFAIEHRLARVEAGAQGEHKLARGYAPVPTYSAHYIADTGFRAAVADFVERESRAVAADIAFLDSMTPFKRGE